MQEWRVYAKRADFMALGQRFGIDPVAVRVIRNRGLTEIADFDKYLHGTVKDLYDPKDMLNLSRAVDILSEAVKAGHRIRIIGDYDIDGICSIYILFQGLIHIGADVDYDIPDRIADGYGINENLIKKSHEEGRDLILTCDNGIAAAAAIDYAKELGMTVIVTDHHEVPYEETAEGRRYILPRADAVVDPKQPQETYPFHELCGAGIAYKLVTLLYEKWQVPAVDAQELIQFAGFATIGDIVPLQDENRILVKEGLKGIHRTTNLGLESLINLCGIQKSQISAYHVGFVIGPCLNASGRLDTAKRAVRLLCATDRMEAETLAGDLKSLNDERKDMTLRATKEAIAYVENEHREEDTVLIVYLPECHESIAGIVAGKVREHFYRPTIVLTRGTEGVKGSARSIESYNIFEKLSECRELLTRFGGHAMAAGLSLTEENIEPLRQKLNERAGLTSEDLIEKVWIDVPMPIDYISEKLIEDLQVLEPFGKSNEKPIFADKNLGIVSVYPMGKEGQYTRMTLQKENGYYMEAVGFFPPQDLIEAKVHGQRLDCTYYPKINEFRGNRKLQISLIGYRIHS